jgi:hypothetical protein
MLAKKTVVAKILFDKPRVNKRFLLETEYELPKVKGTEASSFIWPQGNRRTGSLRGSGNPAGQWKPKRSAR